MMSLSDLNLVDFDFLNDFHHLDLLVVVLDLAVAESSHSHEAASEFLLDLVQGDKSLGKLGELDFGHVSDADSFLSAVMDLLLVFLNFGSEVLNSGLEVTLLVFNLSIMNLVLLDVDLEFVAFFLPLVKLLGEEVTS